MVTARCPPGYMLSAVLQAKMTMSSTKCQCDYENPDIVDCNGHRIVLKVSRSTLV